MEPENELVAETEWTSPDGTLSIAIVSNHDADNKERFYLCLATDDNATVIAEFTENVDYNVIASVTVFIASTQPTISPRMRAMLDGPLTEGK